MGMLADRAEYVIGVDTHRDSHTVAVCTPTGAVIAETTVAADARGYQRLLAVRARAGGGPSGVGDRGHGQLRRRADRAFCSSRASGSSRSTGQRARPAATAPSPTGSTPPAPPAKRSPASTSPSRGDAATGRRCVSCSPAAKAPSSPARRRSAS